MKRPASNRLPLSVCYACALFLAGCTVGPDYVRPSVANPASYKETTGAGWKPAEPALPDASRDWWKIYGDARLDQLETQADAANQTVKSAAANYRAARAQLAQSDAARFPAVTVRGAYNRSRTSANLRDRAAAGTTLPDYLVGAGVSWEPDLWGRIARGIEGARATAAASEADWQGARLSMQAELAANYFELRGIDHETALLREAVAAYTSALDLTCHRYQGGVATEADVDYANAQLTTAQAQALDLTVRRAQLEHAVAVLTGHPPSGFTLSFAPLDTAPRVQPVVTPVGIPSALLERRPDIAAAERRVAAANAGIGIATAAFYPSLTLAVNGGLEATDFSNWLLAPARFWSLGPALAATLFDGGSRRAVREQATAQYDASVAEYRQTVLAAFQQVEDQLAALRILENEARAQDEAVRSARRALALTTDRYTNGAITYIEVTVAQNTALNAQRAAVDIERRRLAASVALIRAVGGGFERASLGAATPRTFPSSM